LRFGTQSRRVLTWRRTEQAAIMLQADPPLLLSDVRY
jgi:hypothetical protein